MEKLTYLVHWGKNKETAWSGTNYSLYKALCKYYQVDDINLKFPKLISVFMHRFYGWIGLLEDSINYSIFVVNTST